MKRALKIAGLVVVCLSGAALVIAAILTAAGFALIAHGWH